jgi:hypothetical protein
LTGVVAILRSISLKRPKPSTFELENVRSLNVGEPVAPVHLRWSPFTSNFWNGDLKPQNMLDFMTGQQQTLETLQISEITDRDWQRR